MEHHSPDDRPAYSKYSLNPDLYMNELHGNQSPAQESFRSIGDDPNFGNLNNASFIPDSQLLRGKPGAMS